MQAIDHGLRAPSNVSTVILAGGQGQRLRPLTDLRCKPAVPFGGNFRIIDFTLMSCAASRLSRIHLLTQYRADSLDDHVRQRWRDPAGPAVRVDTRPARTGPDGSGGYRGTADAVYQNLDLVDEPDLDAVLILSGDHIYHADYRALLAIHARRDADVTVLVGEVPVAEASSFGVLELDEQQRIARFVEKPADPSPHARAGMCAINLGVYCFRPAFLAERLAADAADPRSEHDFGRNVLPVAVARGARVVACPLARVCPGRRPYWRDVGTVDSLLQANLDVLAGAFDVRDPRWSGSRAFHAFRAWAADATPRGGNIVARDVSTRGVELARCVVSPGAHLEPGCQLTECVVMPGARVRRGHRLRRAIIDGCSADAIVCGPDHAGLAGRPDAEIPPARRLARS